MISFLKNGLWFDPTFIKSIFYVLIFLSLMTLVFILKGRKKKDNLRAWASIKSWWITAPLTFISFALPYPAPLILLVIISIWGAKTFFKMTGMYHRSSFVLMTYFFILLSAITVHLDQATNLPFDAQWRQIYNILPMLFFGCLGLIPILFNTTKHMIQYMGLSLMIYLFLGWSFLHLGHILNLEDGIFILIYLYILTEVNDSLSLLANRWWGNIKPFKNITSRISLEGWGVSFILTVIMAWAIRDILPDASNKYWIASALICSCFGAGGQLIMSVIRKDLGIKDNGVFILGKNDILARLNKMIFVGPYFYYVYIFLQTGEL